MLVERVADGELCGDLGDRGSRLAFEPRAERSARRAGSSRSHSRPSAGLTANCTLEPGSSTPISRQHRQRGAVARGPPGAFFFFLFYFSIFFFHFFFFFHLAHMPRSGIPVGQGQRRATVTSQPVCTPIGSMFRIEQMMMQFSAAFPSPHNLHLVFLPAAKQHDSSIYHFPVGEASSPSLDESRKNSDSVVGAMPPPVPPPMVNEADEWRAEPISSERRRAGLGHGVAHGKSLLCGSGSHPRFQVIFPSPAASRSAGASSHRP